MLGVQVEVGGSPQLVCEWESPAGWAWLLRMRPLTSPTHTELLKEGVCCAPLPWFP